MSIGINSFSGGEVSPEIWERTDLEKWASCSRSILNFIPRVRGSVENRAGSHFVAMTRAPTNIYEKIRLYPFQFSTTDWLILEFGHEYLRFYTVDENGAYGPVLSGEDPLEVVTPYDGADISGLKFEQSNDTLYIFHPGYPIHTLIRSGSNSQWLMTTAVFTSKMFPARTVRCIDNGGSNDYYKYGVTAISDSLGESLITVATTPSGAEASARRGGDIVQWDAPVDGNGDQVAVSYYNIYESIGGIWGHVGQVETTSLTNIQFVIPQNPSRNSGVKPYFNDRVVFDHQGVYPSCGAFFAQRLYLANTDQKPQTLWGTVVGDYGSFNKSIPTQDDDAVEFTLDTAAANDIRWMIALDEMLIGTSESEWRMTPGVNVAAITPSVVDLKVQSRWGCSNLPPFIVGESVLFVDGSQKRIRDLSYSLEKDGYSGNDLTVLAQHMFDSTPITQWTYQRFPDAIMWCLLSNGTLAGLTYHKEHKVYAWHRHETYDYTVSMGVMTKSIAPIESLASVVTGEGKSELWLAVQRQQINESGEYETVRCIERIEERKVEADTAFFVDSGLSGGSSVGNTVSGLVHLAGQVVTAVVDGVVYDDLTVSVTGVVTLPSNVDPASSIHIGLPYLSRLEPVGFERATVEGPSADKKRQLTSVFVRLRNTRELWVATAPGYRFFSVPFRTPDDIYSATAAFTGAKEVAVGPSGLFDARVVFEVRAPVPCTIESVTGRVDLGRF
jgi:hypothetical protein